MTIFSKTENNAIKNRGNRGFWRWIAKMSKMVRYGGREKRGRRDWAGGAPPCRSPVADRICLSRAHGEKISILAQGVKGRNEETKHGGPPFAPFSADLKSGTKRHSSAARIPGKGTKTWVDTGTIAGKKCQK